MQILQQGISSEVQEVTTTSITKAPRHGSVGPDLSDRHMVYNDLDLLPRFRSASVAESPPQPLQMSSVPLTSRLEDRLPAAPNGVTLDSEASAGTALSGLHADTVLLATRDMRL